MAAPSTLQYTPLTERAHQAISSAIPNDALVEERVKQFSDVAPRAPDEDGDVETLEGVKFTHHITTAPGDYEIIKWHYATAGSPSTEAIVFLHGIPDSWFQWHYQMAKLSKSYYCVSVDLKGYGQSEKAAGTYLHEDVAEQLYALLTQIGLKKFNLVTHDRGTVQADFIVAKHPGSVLRYGRGEQHLWHFNPTLSPQGLIFQNAPYSGIMNDPKRFVIWTYTFVAGSFPPNDIMARVMQEFSYDEVTKAVPRYFNSSTFRQEWIKRRELIPQWKCPVLVLEGKESRSQPFEFYDAKDVNEWLSGAKRTGVRFVEGGHFWSLESPEDTYQAVLELLDMEL
ncbi:uncharacterized protein N0V89_005270 [Didymosphaeria variabile]|uniref:AB hydrolase-1 domain-containing protein n=1 Tax=Didymosphaeria variabile TaxID=1932322 RepID=A0A9W9CB48_9PLEO|nr:uncharacterized protein N0V89_005270 [Didymosphaeria variabile]KAJ4353540.1 hypothetical protein N0V89_005270 [Didymosphaeria variabile]